MGIDGRGAGGRRIKYTYTGQPDADGFVRVAAREKVSLSWLLGDERPFFFYFLFLAGFLILDVEE